MEVTGDEGMGRGEDKGEEEEDEGGIGEREKERGRESLFSSPFITFKAFPLFFKQIQWGNVPG